MGTYDNEDLLKNSKWHVTKTQSSFTAVTHVIFYGSLKVLLYHSFNCPQ